MPKFVATGAYTDDDVNTVIVNLGVHSTLELAQKECAEFKEEILEDMYREAVTTIVEVSV